MLSSPWKKDVFLSILPHNSNTSAPNGSLLLSHCWMIEHKLASGSSPSAFLSFNGYNKQHTVVDSTEHFCSNIVNETTSFLHFFFTQKNWLLCSRHRGELPFIFHNSRGWVEPCIVNTLPTISWLVHAACNEGTLYSRWWCCTIGEWCMQC